MKRPSKGFGKLIKESMKSSKVNSTKYTLSIPEGEGEIAKQVLPDHTSVTTKEAAKTDYIKQSEDEPPATPPTPEVKHSEKDESEILGLRSQIQILSDTVSEYKTKQPELTEKIQNMEEQQKDLTAQLAEKERLLAEKEQAFESEKESLTVKIEQTNEKLGKLEALMGINGATAKLEGDPQALQVLGMGSEESRKFYDLCKQSVVGYYSSSSGGYEKQHYNPMADEFWKSNESKIRQGVEAELREHGFLKGNRVQQDITDIGDIPSTAFQHLSSMMRSSYRDDLILWQFAAANTQLGVRPQRGVKNFSFPRYSLGANPTSFADVTLTDSTAIVSTTNGLTEDSFAMEIKELGLGKNANNAPIGMTEFVESFSLNDLERLVQDRVVYHYLYSKNLGLQEELFAAANTPTVPNLYNNADTVTTTIGNVTANAKSGVLSLKFLQKAKIYCDKLKTIPTLPDGCYILITNPDGVSSLMDSIDEKIRYQLNENTDIIGNYLKMSRSSFTGGQASGYIGQISGFHIFSQKIFGIGEDGAVGSQDETFGAVDYLTQQSFIMGVDALGWATAKPVELRMDEVTDFGRRKRMIWLSHENAGGLDVIITANTTQRVVGIRHTIEPVTAIA